MSLPDPGLGGGGVGGRVGGGQPKSLKNFRFWAVFLVQRVHKGGALVAHKLSQALLSLSVSSSTELARGCAKNPNSLFDGAALTKKDLFRVGEIKELWFFEPEKGREWGGQTVQHRGKLGPINEDVHTVFIMHPILWREGTLPDADIDETLMQLEYRRTIVEGFH
ncbi:hypothetical protein EDB85DRAFT_1893610 [Lactarius pseudohatsudake]|nr:hypothetical protein EDB85DRAFT_1893610 [Lactarius pseudohatsudake]